MSIKSNKDDSFTPDSNFGQEESYNYDVVNFDIRLQLIKLVCNENYKMSKAARILKINESTAKYIVRTFKKNGKILIKGDKSKHADETLLKELQELQVKFNIDPSKINAKSERRKKKKVYKTQQSIKRSFGQASEHDFKEQSLEKQVATFENTSKAFLTEKQATTPEKISETTTLRENGIENENLGEYLVLIFPFFDAESTFPYWKHQVWN